MIMIMILQEGKEGWMDTKTWIFNKKYETQNTAINTGGYKTYSHT